LDRVAVSSQADARGFPAARLRALAEIEDRHFWFRGRRVLLFRLLARELRQPHRRILDAGCGTGRLLADLHALGHDVAGVDSLSGAVDRSRRACPGADVREGSATALPFPDASFDGVVALDLLEHVDDDRLAASELARVLAAGGWLLVSVPAGPRLWSVRDVSAGHRRRYTRRALRDLLAGAGLNVARLTAYQFALLPLVAAARIAGRKGPALRDREDRPGALVNALLGAVNVAEASLAPFVSLPWGSSLVAVCRKPA
jgi:SAM-dependent methyltransferase